MSTLRSIATEVPQSLLVATTSKASEDRQPTSAESSRGHVMSMDNICETSEPADDSITDVTGRLQPRQGAEHLGQHNTQLAQLVVFERAIKQ